MFVWLFVGPDEGAEGPQQRRKPNISPQTVEVLF